MATRTSRTAKKDWAPAWLEAFEQVGMVTAACDLTGVGRRTVYDRREADEEFARAWDDIVERTTEKMEVEAYRRAVEGWRERGIFNDDGEEVGEVRKYSDTLLIFMLKSRRPQTYRDNHRVEHVGHDGGPVNVRVDLDEKQREALASVLRGRPAARGD